MGPSSTNAILLPISPQLANSSARSPQASSTGLPSGRRSPGDPPSHTGSALPRDSECSAPPHPSDFSAATAGHPSKFEAPPATAPSTLPKYFLSWCGFPSASLSMSSSRGIRLIPQCARAIDLPSFVPVSSSPPPPSPTLVCPHPMADNLVHSSAFAWCFVVGIGAPFNTAKAKDFRVFCAQAARSRWFPV